MPTLTGPYFPYFSSENSLCLLFSSAWNMPYFTMKSTLSCPCSRSDSLFSRQGVVFAHLGSLPPHDVVIWTDGLFHLLFFSLTLSLCSRHSVLSSVFPFTSISLAGTVFFFPIISGYNGSPGIRFSQGTTQLISWPDKKRYSCLCYPL